MKNLLTIAVIFLTSTAYGFQTAKDMAYDEELYHYSGYKINTEDNILPIISSPMFSVVDKVDFIFWRLWENSVNYNQDYKVFKEIDYEGLFIRAKQGSSNAYDILVRTFSTEAYQYYGMLLNRDDILQEMYDSAGVEFTADEDQRLQIRRCILRNVVKSVMLIYEKSHPDSFFKSEGFLERFYVYILLAIDNQNREGHQILCPPVGGQYHRETIVSQIFKYLKEKEKAYENYIEMKDKFTPEQQQRVESGVLVGGFAITMALFVFFPEFVASTIGTSASMEINNRLVSDKRGGDRFKNSFDPAPREGGVTCEALPKACCKPTINGFINGFLRNKKIMRGILCGLDGLITGKKEERHKKCLADQEVRDLKELEDIINKDCTCRCVCVGIGSQRECRSEINWEDVSI